MNIFISHSTKFDYMNELYQPLLKSTLATEHELVFPHLQSGAPTSTKDDVKAADVVVADVSLPATGVGIELGWADDANKPIILMFKEGSKPSRSLAVVSRNFFAYEDEAQMIEILQQRLAELG